MCKFNEGNRDSIETKRKNIISKLNTVVAVQTAVRAILKNTHQ